MRLRTATSLLKWFAILPDLLQTQILADAIKRRQHVENDIRRRGKKPEPHLVGERQRETLLSAIAEKRGLTDLRRTKTKKAKPAAELREILEANQPTTKKTPKSDFLNRHLDLIMELRRKGASIRDVKESLSEYGRVSLGLLQVFLKELESTCGRSVSHSRNERRR